MAAEDVKRSAGTPALPLAVIGLATIAGAFALGSAVDPFAYALALVGVVDLVLAGLIANGRIRLGSPPSLAPQVEQQPSEAQDAAARALADPSYNPYARED